MRIHIVRQHATEKEIQGNRGMEIDDPEVRAKIEAIVRRLLETEPT